MAQSPCLADCRVAFEHAHVRISRAEAFAQCEPLVQRRLLAVRGLLRVDHRTCSRAPRGLLSTRSGDRERFRIEVLETARPHASRFPSRHHEGERVRFVGERDRQPDLADGARQQPELRRHDHTERSLAPDEPVHQVLNGCEARGVLLQRRTAHLEYLAIGQHDGQRTDVCPRRTVAKSPRAGCVAGDRAAHGAFLLAGRIGCEEQSVRGERLLKIAEQDSRFDTHRAMPFIQVEHARHRTHGKQDSAAADGRRGRAGLGPGRGDGYATACGGPHDLHDLLNVRRPRDGVGHEVQPRRIAGVALPHGLVAPESDAHRITKRSRTARPSPNECRTARAARGARRG